MKAGLYETLGEAKCEELAKKSYSLWAMLELGGGSRKSTQVGGVVREGIAKDFIREFLPAGFGLKSGLIFDAEDKKMSPQIDAIIYKGAPLLEFTDVIVVEKEQVKAIFEIKTWIGQDDIFGVKRGGTRNPDTALASDFQRKKDFLPKGAKYILFAFELHSSSSDREVSERLMKISDSYAVIIRREPRVERKAGKEPRHINFDNSVSRLIEWLRNLS